MRGLGGAAARPGPSVTAHPSTASVPVIVLSHNGPLLCGFSVLLKALTYKNTKLTGRCANESSA